jgi:hypothetical protein
VAVGAAAGASVTAVGAVAVDKRSGKRNVRYAKWRSVRINLDAEIEETSKARTAIADLAKSVIAVATSSARQTEDRPLELAEMRAASVAYLELFFLCNRLKGGNTILQGVSDALTGWWTALAESRLDSGNDQEPSESAHQYSLDREADEPKPQIITRGAEKLENLLVELSWLDRYLGRTQRNLVAEQPPQPDSAAA